MKPIYEPKGRAKEYGDYAINIYTGCPHRCYYCFAPGVLHKDREKFHSYVVPREGIVEAVAKQLEREQITGKTIHLCFTCDPYPTGCNTTTTRAIIKLLKAAGNHVQILTMDNQNLKKSIRREYQRNATLREEIKQLRDLNRMLKTARKQDLEEEKRLRKEMGYLEKEREMLWKTVDRISGAENRGDS